MDNNQESRVKKNMQVILLGIIFICIISIKSYFQLCSWGIEKYWISVPALVFVLVLVLQRRLSKRYILLMELSISAFISTILALLVIKIDWIYIKFLEFEEVILVVSFLFLLGFAIYTLSRSSFKSVDEKDDDKELFNLFYINTSKVHEIAMLIDNKIMKTVERQRNKKENVSSSANLGLNRATIGTTLSHTIESSNERNVYESFDVKTTKSVMLRTIYSSINRQRSSEKELGKILLFKNVELKQRNTDDTVMVLNIVKDGNMKQLSNDDNFELNLSKMMDAMLDDFTIDYTFDQDGEKYLIQIPFESKDYFENNYSHSDLQLGKLSVVGIYRGDIDFTNIDSISSKFLEIFSESYKSGLSQNNNKNGVGLVPSRKSNDDKEYEFTIEHNKLKGNHHLIDLIAIIQEIKIESGEQSD